MTTILIKMKYVRKHQSGAHTKILFLEILFWICVVNVYISTQ